MEDQKINDKIALLQKLPIFKAWTRTALERILFYFEEKRYTRKQVVFREGTPSTEVYLIKDGEFKLNKGIKLDLDLEDPTRKKKNRLKKKKSYYTGEITMLSRG